MHDDMLIKLFFLGSCALHKTQIFLRKTVKSCVFLDLQIKQILAGESSIELVTDNLKPFDEVWVDILTMALEKEPDHARCLGGKSFPPDSPQRVEEPPEVENYGCPRRLDSEHATLG